MADNLQPDIIQLIQQPWFQQAKKDIMESEGYSAEKAADILLKGYAQKARELAAEQPRVSISSKGYDALGPLLNKAGIRTPRQILEGAQGAIGGESAKPSMEELIKRQAMGLEGDVDYEEFDQQGFERALRENTFPELSVADLRSAYTKRSKLNPRAAYWRNQGLPMEAARAEALREAGHLPALSAQERLDAYAKALGLLPGGVIPQEVVMAPPVVSPSVVRPPIGPADTFDRAQLGQKPLGDVPYDQLEETMRARETAPTLYGPAGTPTDVMAAGRVRPEPTPGSWEDRVAKYRQIESQIRAESEPVLAAAEGRPMAEGVDKLTTDEQTLLSVAAELGVPEGDPQNPDRNLLEVVNTRIEDKWSKAPKSLNNTARAVLDWARSNPGSSTIDFVPANLAERGTTLGGETFAYDLIRELDDAVAMAPIGGINREYLLGGEDPTLVAQGETNDVWKAIDKYINRAFLKGYLPTEIYRSLTGKEVVAELGLTDDENNQWRQRIADYIDNIARSEYVQVYQPKRASNALPKSPMFYNGKGYFPAAPLQGNSIAPQDVGGVNDPRTYPPVQTNAQVRDITGTPEAAKRRKLRESRKKGK